MSCDSQPAARWAIGRLTSFAILTSFAVLTAASAEDHWPRFRGPNGSGLSDATTVPVEWTEADYNWKIKLPGTGHSSPVIWRDRLFVTCSDQKTATRMLVCLDAHQGKVLWQRDFPAKVHSQHQYNNFASTTPAVDAEHVYMLWATPAEVTLLAVDHTGKDVWRRGLGGFDSMHGIGTSPIVVGDLVVLGNDQQGKASLIAVDRSSGKTRWQIDRKSGLVPASTPCLHDDGQRGPRLIFTSTSHGITAVDPAKGTVDWQLEKVFLDRCVGSPISVDGLVVASYGFGTKGTRMLGVRPLAEAAEPEIVIDMTETVPLTCTPIAYRGLLFCWTDDGRITCLRLSNGEVVWRDKLSARFFGSPVCVNGRLYCLSVDGEVFVLAAGDKFNLLARNPLGELSYATPAIAFGRMYLRTSTQLISIGGK
ncbi:MAG: outer membrane protein assembly factor BamB [Pirellulaceae bacterium]|jgi:outer membrane protein assembly factor BamB